MKFIEYLEKSQPTGIKLLLLGGADVTLKNYLRLNFLKQTGLQKEYLQIENIQDLIFSMEEGSFFGPRLFDVFFIGKAKSLSLWNDVFNIVSMSDHTMVLSFEGEGGEWTDATFDSHPGIVWVDCNFPKNNREKINFVKFLLGHRKISLDNPDLITEIAARVKTSLELENFLTCVKLLLEHNFKINIKDVRTLLSGSNHEESSTRDLIRGNIGKLTEALETSEPLGILSFWITVLKRFYFWLCQDALDTTVPGKSDDDEDDVGENSQIISKYQLREYRNAKKRCSLRLVREVMEDLNSIYQDCCAGRTDLWRERTRVTIQRLAVRA